MHFSRLSREMQQKSFVLYWGDAWNCMETAILFWAKKIECFLRSIQSGAAHSGQNDEIVVLTFFYLQLNHPGNQDNEQ